MNVMPPEVGWVEVVCGPMFSGKSEELIRRLRRASIARLPVQAFKPRIDDRYHKSHIVSHTAVAFDAQPTDDTSDVAYLLRPATRVVGIDEVQWYGDSIVPLVERLAEGGVRVIVAGLDQDFRGRPFGPMPALLAVAESVTKLLAICARCGAPAGRSQRLRTAGGGDGPQVEVGGAELYEARCRRCHSPEVEARTPDLF